MDGIIGYFSAHPIALAVIAYLLIINIAVFILCGADKYKSKRGLWRIRERTFFTLSILGGSPFMLLGMYTFRHKTKHLEFTVCVPMILALQIVLVVYLQYKSGIVTKIFF